jgi:hypothetical protein
MSDIRRPTRSEIEQLRDAHLASCETECIDVQLAGGWLQADDVLEEIRRYAGERAQRYVSPYYLRIAGIAGAALLPRDREGEGADGN